MDGRLRIDIVDPGTPDVVSSADDLTILLAANAAVLVKKFLLVAMRSFRQ